MLHSWSDSELCKLEAKQLCNCFKFKDCERTKILAGFSVGEKNALVWMVVCSRGGDGENWKIGCERGRGGRGEWGEDGESLLSLQKKKVWKSTVAQYLEVEPTGLFGDMKKKKKDGSFSTTADQNIVFHCCCFYKMDVKTRAPTHPCILYGHF